MPQTWAERNAPKTSSWAEQNKPKTSSWADLNKPKVEEQQTGKSHGWLADKAWNAGKGILDITGLSDSPVMQLGKSIDTFSKENQTGTGEIEQKKRNEALLSQLDETMHSPWKSAKAAADYMDPTGTIPGYMNLAEAGVQDVKNKDLMSLAGHTALGALPFVLPKVLSVGSKLLGGAKPTIVPPVEPIESYSGPRQLTGRKPQLALPAIGQTTDNSLPRFYQGKAGVVDALDSHKLDWADPAKLHSSNVGSALTSSELGEVTPANPMDVAQRGRAGLGELVNRPRINPNVNIEPNYTDESPAIRNKNAGNIFPTDQMIESDLPFQRPKPKPNQIIGTQLNKLTYPNTPVELPYGTVNQSKLVPNKPFKIHAFTDTPYEAGAGLSDVPEVEKPFQISRDTEFPRGKTPSPTGSDFEEALRAKVEAKRAADKMLPSAVKTKGRTLPAVETPPVVEKLGLKDPNKLTVTGAPKGKSALELLRNAADKAEAERKNPTPKTQTSQELVKDPGALKANYASPHTTLLNNPKTEGLARPILESLDKKQQWIRDKLDQASVHVKGLSKGDRNSIGEALATGDTSKLTPENLNRTKGIRKILDDIDKESPTPELFNTKGIEDHFTEPAKKGFIRSGIDLFKDKKVTTGEAPKVTNYDIRDALPKYVKSAGRELFDKPAIEAAKGQLDKLPTGSNLKDLADWYIKSYEKHSSGALDKEVGSFASKAANLTARAVVDWNPGLHALHLGELPTTVMPKIGLKNTLYGMKEVLSNPTKYWNETSKLGLIADEAKPYAFKSAGEKYRSAAYLFNSAEKFVKGTGYAGAKKMFLDQGLSETVASQKALGLTKDMTLDTGPARGVKGLSPKSDIAGGAVASKLGGQFKATPLKFAEQLTRTLGDTKSNPGATAKMLAGTLGTIGATKAGARMFHLDPSSLLETAAWGPFGETLKDTGKAAYRGDYETAIEDALAGTIPGGRAAKKIYESLTNKVERDKQKSAQLARETKSGNPPLNSARRIFDYLSK